LQQARSCFRRAEQLAPSNPIILQRIANFHLQTGELAEALNRTYRVLQRVRDYDDIIFSSYLRFGIPQPMVLTQGVPPDAGQSYLRFVFTRNDLATAAAAWHWAAGLRRTPPMVTDALAISYVKLLWRQREFASAAQTWAAYLGSHAEDHPHSNRLFNGGFESEPTDNPLDWSRGSLEGVQIQRDAQVQEEGKASLRIAFLGTHNLDFHQFGQTQPVPPGTYRFRAMVKTQSITTDQGVRLRIVDPEGPARLDVSTPAMTGTSDWHAVEQGIEVRLPTRLVRIEVARQPSLKFDNKIAGTLWLDAVSLTPSP